MNEIIQFVVMGKPFGKERPRFAGTDQNGKVITYTPQKTKSYEELVQLDFYEQVQSKRGKLHGFNKDDYLKMVVKAFFPFPSNAKKNEIELMKKGIIRPAKRPDVDNIFKVVADSLNKIAYHDDAQIVESDVRKFYSDVPRVEVSIYKI